MTPVQIQSPTERERDSGVHGVEKRLKARAELLHDAALSSALWSVGVLTFPDWTPYGGNLSSYKGQMGRRKDNSIGFSAYQMVCCCLAVSNETEAEATRSAPLFEGPEELDVPGAGFADLYPWPRKIISQPLVVFEEATEL